MERRPRVRLTPAQMEDAARRHESGESLRSIAASSGCHFTTLSKALAKKRPAAVGTALVVASPKGAVKKPEREVIYIDDRRPPTRQYRDLPVVGLREWSSVDAVRAALVQHDNGQFQLAAMLIDAMLSDDRVGGVWSCRADGLVGLPLEMAPPKGLKNDTKAIEVARECEETWETVEPEQAITELLKWGRFLGIGIAEKIYDNPDDPFTPRLKVWHPRYLWWNWGTRVLQLVTQDGTIALDPMDPAVQRQWIIYAPWGIQRGWVNGRVRALAIPWLIRQWTWRDHARHNEVHGIPIRKVKVPSQWDDEEKQRAMSEIAQLATESVVRCPVDSEGKGFDLELVEPKGNSFEAFTSLQSRADTAIAVVLLGQNLTTEIGEKGSRAAAQVHDRVRQDVIRSDAQSLSRCLHRQLVQDIVIFRRGQEAKALTPWPMWDLIPPRDEMMQGTALRAVMEALKVARETQLPIDFESLCANFGVPLQPGVEIEEYEDPLVEVAEVKAESAVEAAKERPAPVAPKAGDLSAVLAVRPLGLLLDGAPSLPAAAVRGQAYTDAIAAVLEESGVKAMAPFLARMLSAIDGADGYEQIRLAVLAAFKDEAAPEDLARLVEHAVLLADMNGRLAVREE